MNSARCILLALTLFMATPVRAADEPIPREVESAVDRGLEWLARNQQRDGNWSSGAGTRSAAVTGLATMAFMARGHVPGQGPYGENLNHAIDYLLALHQPDDVLAESRLERPMYDHGICTIALCEAYGMLDDRRQDLARTAINRAVSVILSAQRVPKSVDEQGGWRYQSNTYESDLSVTGWQLMALRGAKNIGAAIPAYSIDAGIAYIKRRAVNNGTGGFAYQGQARVTPALTGTGILSLILLGQPDASEVKAGGDYLLRSDIGIGRTNNYFYTAYYCAQAAWQLSGNYWVAINRNISNDLRKAQRADGSWSLSPGLEAQGGESYSTSMAILALTVPYRYLPIYQR